MSEQRGDRFEAHASVEALGGQCVSKLVGVDSTDPGAPGDGRHVAVDGSPVEGLSVVAFEQEPVS